MLQPSATTKKASLKGSDTTDGGTIIIPIDIRTAATTRSMIRNGRKTRKPISKARWNFRQHEGGHHSDSGASNAGPLAPGAGLASGQKCQGLHDQP